MIVSDHHQDVTLISASLHIKQKAAEEVLRCLGFHRCVNHLLPLEGPLGGHQSGAFPRFRQKGGVTGLTEAAANLLLGDLLTIRDLLIVDCSRMAVEMAGLPEHDLGYVKNPRLAWSAIIEARREMVVDVESCISLVRFCADELARRNARLNNP